MKIMMFNGLLLFLLFMWTSAETGPETELTEEIQVYANESRVSIQARKRACENLGGKCIKKKKDCPSRWHLETKPGKPYCSKNHRCCYPGPSCNLVWNYKEERPLIMIRDSKTIVPPVLDIEVSDYPSRIPIGRKLIFACPGANNQFNHVEGTHTKLHGECISHEQFKVCVNSNLVKLNLSQLSCSRKMHPSFIKDNATSDKNSCDGIGGEPYKQGYTYGDKHEFKDLEIEVCFSKKNKTTLCTSSNLHGNETDYRTAIKELPGRDTRTGGSSTCGICGDTDSETNDECYKLGRAEKPKVTAECILRTSRCGGRMVEKKCNKNDEKCICCLRMKIVCSARGDCEKRDGKCMLKEDKKECKGTWDETNKKSCSSPSSCGCCLPAAKVCKKSDKCTSRGKKFGFKVSCKKGDCPKGVEISEGCDAKENCFCCIPYNTAGPNPSCVAEGDKKGVKAYCLSPLQLKKCDNGQLIPDKCSDGRCQCCVPFNTAGPNLECKALGDAKGVTASCLSPFELKTCGKAKGTLFPIKPNKCDDDRCQCCVPFNPCNNVNVNFSDKHVCRGCNTAASALLFLKGNPPEKGARDPYSKVKDKFIPGSTVFSNSPEFIYTPSTFKDEGKNVETCKIFKPVKTWYCKVGVKEDGITRFWKDPCEGGVNGMQCTGEYKKDGGHFFWKSLSTKPEDCIKLVTNSG